MPKGLKAVLVGVVLLVGSGVVAVVSLFAIAVTAGPSIAAGERAAVISGGIDVFLGLFATVVFGIANRGLKPVWLAVATAAYAILQFLLLGVVFLLNLILLNR